MERALHDFDVALRLEAAIADPRFLVGKILYPAFEGWEVYRGA